MNLSDSILVLAGFWLYAAIVLLAISVWQNRQVRW
jgi:hypothetical protein